MHSKIMTGESQFTVTSVSEIILYSLNWTIFLDLTVKEYLNTIPTRRKLVDGLNASFISLPVFGKKAIKKRHEEKSTISY